MPKISVIVPVYKVEQYLTRCIDSILNQTYKDYEIIIIDDGSPDNCGTILDDYANKFNFINIIHQKNGGLSAARNSGLDYIFAISDSEYITFVDSDDYVEPLYLDTLFSNLKQLNADVSICSHYRFSDSNRKSYKQNVDSDCPYLINVNDLFCDKTSDFVFACGKLYSKYLFSKIRYSINKHFEDAYTTWKILFDDIAISYNDYQLYGYYVNNDGIYLQNKNNFYELFEPKMEKFEYLQKNIDKYKKSFIYTLKTNIKILVFKMIEDKENRDSYNYKKTKYLYKIVTKKYIAPLQKNQLKKMIFSSFYLSFIIYESYYKMHNHPRIQKKIEKMLSDYEIY